MPSPEPCANDSITAFLILTAVVAPPKPILTIPLTPEFIARSPDDVPTISFVLVVEICAVVATIPVVVI